MQQAMGVDEELEALYDEAYKYRCEGKYPEAKAELQKLLTKQPRHMKALWLWGLIQGFEGDFEGSIRTLTKIVDIWPDVPAMRYDLAMSQVMLGMSDEAYLNFQEVLRQNPDHEDARRQLAYF